MFLLKSNKNIVNVYPPFLRQEKKILLDNVNLDQEVRLLDYTFVPHPVFD